MNTNNLARLRSHYLRHGFSYTNTIVRSIGNNAWAIDVIGYDLDESHEITLFTLTGSNGTYAPTTDLWGELRTLVEAAELPVNYDESYPVFCMAILLRQKGEFDDHSNLDEWWLFAQRVYRNFLQTKFNSAKRSELECMIDYINNGNHLKFKNK